MWWGLERPSLSSTSPHTLGKGRGDKCMGTFSSLRPEEKPDEARGGGGSDDRQLPPGTVGKFL